ncbi:MAG: hypothetical protein ACYSSI_02800 [Planctomycetota bacterium]|jgi:hypothetical protein
MGKSKKTRPGGLEPPTFGFEVCKTKNVTDLKSRIYKLCNKQYTGNYTKNYGTIQQDLANIIKRWPLLSPSIRTAIMVLIGGDEDE